MSQSAPLREPEPIEVAFTPAQIAEYARASGDTNPIHLDADFARSVGLPGLIAHGMLQMGILARVAVGCAGDHRRLRRLSCRFAGMVRPGDVVTFGGRLVPADEHELELWAENQDGVRVLTKATARLAAQSAGAGN